MHRLRFRLAVAVLAFVVGTSLDVYLRRPGPGPECGRVSFKCHVVDFADLTADFPRHPVETTERISNLLASEQVAFHQRP